MISVFTLTLYIYSQWYVLKQINIAYVLYKKKSVIFFTLLFIIFDYFPSKVKRHFRLEFYGTDLNFETEAKARSLILNLCS